MLSWCEMVANMTQPPMVLSISWGNGEVCIYIYIYIMKNILKY